MSDIDLMPGLRRSRVRYRSNHFLAAVTMLALALPAAEAEARAWRHDVAWSNLQVAQRKPWADEVMEAIGRRPTPSPNQPSTQPGTQGRDQQGQGAREGGVGIRGGSNPGGEGREPGPSEGQPRR